jgi:hypothetical protein
LVRPDTFEALVFVEGAGGDEVHDEILLHQLRATDLDTYTHAHRMHNGCEGVKQGVKQGVNVIPQRDAEGSCRSVNARARHSLGTHIGAVVLPPSGRRGWRHEIGAANGEDSIVNLALAVAADALAAEAVKARQRYTVLNELLHANQSKQATDQART